MREGGGERGGREGGYLIFVTDITSTAVEC